MNVLCPQLALIGPIGWPELLIIGIIALLIFGRRLPDVARNLGKGIVEFKKGLGGIEDDLNNAGDEKKKSDSSTRINSPPSSQSTDTTESEPQTQPRNDSQTHGS